MEILGLYDMNGNILSQNDIEDDYNMTSLNDFLYKMFSNKKILVDEESKNFIPKGLQGCEVGSLEDSDVKLGSNVLVIVGKTNFKKYYNMSKNRYVCLLDTKIKHESYGKVNVTNLFRGIDAQPKILFRDHLMHDAVLKVYKVRRRFEATDEMATYIK